MHNIDNYPDSPCYNCIVRATCAIPDEIGVKQHTEHDTNTGEIKRKTYGLCIQNCQCLKLWCYLANKDSQDQLEFMSQCRFGRNDKYLTIDRYKGILEWKI